MIDLALKKEIQHKTTLIIQEKIKSLELALESLSSSNEDTKSTAGDKHEVGRAMVHIEQEKLSNQLIEAQKLHNILLGCNPEKISLKGGLGALVETKKVIFYLSIGIGKIEIDNFLVYSVSLASPIGQQLIDLKVGDMVLFNGAQEEILSIC